MYCVQFSPASRSLPTPLDGCIEIGLICRQESIKAAERERRLKYRKQVVTTSCSDISSALLCTAGRGEGGDQVGHQGEGQSVYRNSG